MENFPFKIKKFIRREQYMHAVEPYIDKEIIKVIVGQRRVGKSYMLFQIMDYIVKQNHDAKIIYVNKELHDFEEIKSHTDLINYVKSQHNKHEKYYLFIDEIQEISDFEKALRHFLAQDNCDIYCTGSNANLLSGELATFLGGRYIEIKIYGLSFTEFLEFHNLKNSKENFIKYLKYGGLPYLINLKLDDQIIFDYLKNIYATILFKDVLARNEIRNVSFLENLVKYLADNTGQIVSANKISEFLKSQRSKLSPSVVLNYLSFLENAFFVFKVNRAEVVGKKIFEIGEKYYFEDLGLRNAIVGFRQTDISKILENVVFLHLKANGYSITVGKNGDKEIDFVCERNGERIYVQVSYLIADDKTREREFGNLLEIKDNYPKFVVSLDEIGENTTYMGVVHKNIRTFVSNPV